MVDAPKEIPSAALDSAARTRLLVTALEKGGGGASGGCANLLRKWAREGRPYRGQVFQLQEVEDAIRAVAAQLVAANGTAVAAETLKAKQEAAAQGAASQEAGEKSLGDVTMPSGNDEERVVTVRARDWPCKEVLDSAVNVACSLGPLRRELAAEDRARAEMLKSLYAPGLVNGCSAGHAKHADVQVKSRRDASVGAHRDILSAVSEVLKCKFNSSFADATSTCIDATMFEMPIVRAAVEFAYLGRCQLPLGDLGLLFGLADFWQFQLLSEAAKRSGVCHLKVRFLERRLGADLRVTAGTAVDATMEHRDLLHHSRPLFDVLLRSHGGAADNPGCRRITEHDIQKKTLANWLVALMLDLSREDTAQKAVGKYALLIIEHSNIGFRATTGSLETANEAGQVGSRVCARRFANIVFVDFSEICAIMTVEFWLKPSSFAAHAIMAARRSNTMLVAALVVGLLCCLHINQHSAFVGPAVSSDRALRGAVEVSQQDLAQLVAAGAVIAVPEAAQARLPDEFVIFAPIVDVLPILPIFFFLLAFLWQASVGMGEVIWVSKSRTQPRGCGFSWKFVQEVHDCLSELPAAAVGRLRSWVGKDDDELAPAVERFMLAAIRAASSTAAAIGGDLTNLRWICRRHFKLLLPEPMICRIVTAAVAADSFIDSAGQTRHWLQWAYSGGPNLSVLWEARCDVFTSPYVHQRLGAGSPAIRHPLPVFAHGLARPSRICCQKPLAHQLPSGSRAQQFGGHAAVACAVALLLTARAAASSRSRRSACRRPSRRRPQRIRIASQQTESGALQSAGAEWQQEEEAERLLREFFGHESWRCEQQVVVKAAVQKQDVLVNWSTGAGKSLCYQLPAVLAWRRRRGVTLVVEPLISLMRDQVVNFNKLSSSSDSPKATFLGSGQSDLSMDKRALEGEFCLVYVTPEKLTEGLLLGLEQLYKSRRLELIVMDEAACISLWGHDFRPSFRNMWWVREQYPQIPFMALSGSMTEDMQRDISEQLCLRAPFVSTLPYLRANLDITCTHKEGFAKDMARIVQAVRLGEPMIVYTPLPSRAVKVAAKLESLLQDQDVQVGVYTGATEKGERERVQSAFDSGEVHVLVATVAFGMGIDKPDIRKIIHYGLPKCMEYYHQQIGRAGRDGLRSSCVMLFDNSDWKLWYSKIFTQEYENWDKDDLRKHLESSEHLHQLVVGHGCRHQSILSYFGCDSEIELLKSSTLCRCDVCLGRRGDWFGSVKPRGFFREARLVLEAVRMAQELTKGKCASKEAVLKLVTAKSQNALIGIPKIMIDRLWAVRDELPRCRRSKAYSSQIFDMLYGDGYLMRKLTSTQEFRSFLWSLTDFGESALSWGKSVHLVPTRSIQNLELDREGRNKVEHAQRMYKTMKSRFLKSVPFYLGELRNSSSEDAPDDERDMWRYFASMSDSMKEGAVNARDSIKMYDNSKDEEDMSKGKPSVAEAISGMATCTESVRSSSMDAVTSLCSDLDGESRHEVLKWQEVCVMMMMPRNPNVLTLCVVTLHVLGGLQFSTKKAYTEKTHAKIAAIMHAAFVLIKARTGTARSFQMSRLLACLSERMQRPLVEEDVQFRFLEDSNNCFWCDITVPALGSKQESRLLACLAKQIRRTPVKEDVEFRYAVVLAISRACCVLDRTDAISAGASIGQGSVTTSVTGRRPDGYRSSCREFQRVPFAARLTEVYVLLRRLAAESAAATAEAAAAGHGLDMFALLMGAVGIHDVEGMRLAGMSRVCVPLPLHDGKCRGFGFSIATTSVEGHVERPSKVRYHRSLILFACILGVVQYDLVTVIGLVTPDLELKPQSTKARCSDLPEKQLRVSYYGLNPGEGDILYDAVNFWAFGLSFLPGMCYDHIGPAASMAVGTVLGVLSQLDWSPVFPDLDTMTQLYLSSLMFGLAACFFSVIAVLTPLEVFPAKHLGKTSAAIQVSLSLGVTLQSQVNNLLGNPRMILSALTTRTPCCAQLASGCS
ncbi:unnamed protein product [Polarella glacialis]|uniref:DNA 3'-5' helicase n=1 Tax=Polarella glacialis TaxID=89957 RepID=A0A813FS68_POLGL|nr:unnamed protein product [Polarella glacialis]